MDFYVLNYKVLRKMIIKKYVRIFYNLAKNNKYMVLYFTVIKSKPGSW